MVLVHVGSVVVLTTGETTTTWVLAVLADTTVTGGNVSTVLSGLGKVGRHLLCQMIKCVGVIVVTVEVGAELRDMRRIVGGEMRRKGVGNVR